MPAEPTEPDPASDPSFTELPESVRHEILKLLAASAPERAVELQGLCQTHSKQPRDPRDGTQGQLVLPTFPWIAARKPRVGETG